MSNDSDARIVEACLSGDRAAFRVLMDRYEKKMFNLAYRVVDDREDAMDATQTAFVKAYENLQTFDPSRKFFSWMYRILLNESLNILKRRKRFDDLYEHATVESDNPEETYAAAETGQRIHKALMELKTDYRAVVVLRHYHDMSYKEIGEVVGISEKTIKSRLFSARRQLKDILMRKGIVR
ncbi:MAG: RNA polymerase sigma factor [Candidatus Krumholzibacteria bacterium]|nr:RNA polymerase sigma factor [Candidatus Krumholzibacteria bacterium]